MISIRGMKNKLFHSGNDPGEGLMFIETISMISDPEVAHSPTM